MNKTRKWMKIIYDAILDDNWQMEDLDENVTDFVTRVVTWTSAFNIIDVQVEVNFCI